ncbi:hypothetical protein HMPREF0379_1652 [[Eubacterium] yurii subsp. margaretiae ATCC 43715]|nr:hypothetical protein HMPREF0379_1652 [[Eubacterium] yurii subsp. margaretiae ATCC 43715]
MDMERDYINLGSGAEIGIYNNPEKITTKINRFANEKIKREVESWRKDVADKIKGFYLSIPDIGQLNFIHWDSVPFEIPMTISLYDYKAPYTVDTLFLWRPTQPQWWITGFNPIKKKPDPKDLVVIGTLDLKNKIDFYDALELRIKKNLRLSKYMIFDKEEKKVWIVWWDQSLNI